MGYNVMDGDVNHGRFLDEHVFAEIAATRSARRADGVAVQVNCCQICRHSVYPQTPNMAFY